MADTKRRLPVLKSDGSPDVPEEPRPRWHWSAFGALMIFTVWLPLAYLGTAIARRLAPAPDGAAEATTSGATPGSAVMTALVTAIVPLALAAGAGGFLVGRFGKPSGTREAALAGVAAGGVAVGMAAASGFLAWSSLAVLAVATGFAALGGAYGVKKRGP
jgi:hypothetical protein